MLFRLLVLRGLVLAAAFLEVGEYLLLQLARIDAELRLRARAGDGDGYFDARTVLFQQLVERLGQQTLPSGEHLGGCCAGARRTGEVEGIAAERVHARDIDRSARPVSYTHLRAHE